VEELFFFDPESLATLADGSRGDFLTAAPFPHVVIDGLIPEYLLDKVVGESPEPHEREDWIRADRADAVKLSISHDWLLGPTTRHLLNQFNAAVFIEFLERLTGISGLIPDPHYFGGGLHQIERGGFLKIHADFNRHGRLKLDRRINVLLYLNRDWQEAWGGQLELWNDAMTHKAKAISPVFNRMVVFATTDIAFHGHPDPLRCPPGIRRRSLALYYYSNGRPEHEQSEEHSTLHQVRPGEEFDPGPPGSVPVGVSTSPLQEDLYSLSIERDALLVQRDELQSERNALRDERGAWRDESSALKKELDRDLYRTARILRHGVEEVPLAESIARRTLRLVRFIKQRTRRVRSDP
jgi:hypothetical protein